MKMDYDNFAAELSESFPRTPEKFQQMVSREVRAQMRTSPNESPKNESHRRKWSPQKALLPAAACLLLAGGTVAAANLPVFQEWLNGLGSNAETVGESIVHNGENGDIIIMESPAQSQPDTADSDTQDKLLFTVTDAYYDGITLIFWARPCNDYFELGDHVYINGIDSRLEYVSETEEGSGIYECKVTVVSPELQQADTGSIEVKVGVYTSPDSKSDFSFTVESDKLRSAAKSTGTVSDLDFGKIVSYDVTVAPSVINLHLEWEVYEESMLDILPWGQYILQDASGKRLTEDEWLRSAACSIPERDDASGYTTFSQDLEIKGFDAASPTMTLIPVRVQLDASGSRIPGSEETMEDCAITIDLTK